MENSGYDPKYYYLNEIYLSTIVFDETENLTLIGLLLDEQKEKLVMWNFFCGFSFLTDILICCGEAGDALIKIISEKLSVELEIPSIIDVENLFGNPLLIDTIVFKVYQPHSKDDNGIWQPIEENSLYIDSMERIDTFFKNNPDASISSTQNGKIVDDHNKNSVDSHNIDSSRNHLNEYLLVLDNAFKYYSLLKAKNFTENESRKMAGLSEELLFRIA